jgi:hypothetical protein
VKIAGEDIAREHSPTSKRPRSTSGSLMRHRRDARRHHAMLLAASADLLHAVGHAAVGPDVDAVERSDEGLMRYLHRRSRLRSSSAVRVTPAWRLKRSKVMASDEACPFVPVVVASPSFAARSQSLAKVPRWVAIMTRASAGESCGGSFESFAVLGSRT